MQSEAFLCGIILGILFTLTWQWFSREETCHNALINCNAKWQDKMIEAGLAARSLDGRYFEFKEIERGKVW